MPSKIVWVDAGGQSHSLDELLVHDSRTKSIIFNDLFHSELHASRVFTANKTFTHGAGASPNVLFITPSDSSREFHFFFQATSDNVLTLTLYEDADYAGGTALPAYNRECFHLFCFCQ